VLHRLVLERKLALPLAEEKVSQDIALNAITEQNQRTQDVQAANNDKSDHLVPLNSPTLRKPIGSRRSRPSAWIRTRPRGISGEIFYGY
jgi:hypothetical protein